MNPMQIADQIESHWKENSPKAFGTYDPNELRRQAEAQASLVEAEIEAQMAIGQDRISAVSSAMPMFLTDLPPKA